MLARLLGRVKWLALAVVTALAGGTLGFSLIEGWHPFDAFYMTLTTVTTVGYKEVHDLSPAGRVFNTFLIVFGVTTIFYAIGMMTQTVVELELGEVFGKRRMKRMIEKLENHYIVCGYGRVGRAASRELQRAGAPFVVVDRNPDRAERAIAAGMLAFTADSTRDETLREVGVERAKGLIAALTTDADNLFLILSAKTLNPALHVVTRAAEEDAESKLQRAGADTVFAPYRNTGNLMALSLLQPHVVHFLDVTTTSVGLDINIEQVRVSESSELASRSLRQVQLRRELGVIVLAIRRASGEMQFNPPADAVIEGGDYLIMMGETENLRRAEALLAGGKA